MRLHSDARHSMDRPTVAVYRDILLNPNEPFIRSQAEALQRYRSEYVCMRRVEGLDVPAERTFALHGGSVAGRAMEYVFKTTGVSPTLSRRLRALHPSLLHAYTGVDGAVALPLARRLQLPLVVTFTGFDATATEQQLRNSSQRCWTYMRRRDQLRQSAALTISVSHFIKRVLVRRGYSDDEVIVHHIGVDRDFFRADRQPIRQPLVLFAARLIEMKGATYLIRAMREVQARVRGAELVIAGDGELRAGLEAEARALGARATFLGFKSPHDIRVLMNRARVLCVPSVNASNGMADSLPLVALEAQAMGLPVVAFDTGGLAEELVDGGTGLLAPERDVATLARHLEALLTNQELWARLSSAGPEFVAERFDLQRQAAELETLYDRILRSSAEERCSTGSRAH